MKDLKLKCWGSGLGGADCIISVSKTDNWINLTNFSNGFAIEGNAAALTLTFYQ